MQAHPSPKPRPLEWLALALVLAATLVTTFAMAGSLSNGTSLAVLAVLGGSFILAIGSLFGRDDT
jgi:drug/metabolite transporter (DMT)-like permease